MSRQPNEKINYLYGRLSHEDELAGDSNSIINQRKILTKYAEDNGFTPYEFIYDDGFSGADFERPSFSRMIEDVEAGKVSTVIVKDMSRFGRDYLKVGFYTEILFSEKEVRLIAVNDGVDTGRGENDFAPMMNIFKSICCLRQVRYIPLKIGISAYQSNKAIKNFNLLLPYTVSINAFPNLYVINQFINGGAV